MVTLEQILEEHTIKKGKPELLKSEIIQCIKEWLQQKQTYYKKKWYGEAILATKQIFNELLEELK